MAATEAECCQRDQLEQQKEREVMMVGLQVSCVTLNNRVMRSFTKRRKEERSSDSKQRKEKAM